MLHKWKKNAFDIRELDLRKSWSKIFCLEFYLLINFGGAMKTENIVKGMDL